MGVLATITEIIVPPFRTAEDDIGYDIHKTTWQAEVLLRVDGEVTREIIVFDSEDNKISVGWVGILESREENHFHVKELAL